MAGEVGDFPGWLQIAVTGGVLLSSGVLAVTAGLRAIRGQAAKQPESAEQHFETIADTLRRLCRVAEERQEIDEKWRRTLLDRIDEAVRRQEDIVRSLRVPPRPRS